jgi:hypothetical protein
MKNMDKIMIEGNSYLLKYFSLKKVDCIKSTTTSYQLRFENRTTYWLEKWEFQHWSLIEDLGPTKVIPDRSEYDKCTSTKHNSVCLERSADDEPIFVLTARDVAAPIAVEEWVKLSRRHELHPESKLEGALALADEMREWRLKNIKDPDAQK